MALIILVRRVIEYQHWLNGKKKGRLEVLLIFPGGLIPLLNLPMPDLDFLSTVRYQTALPVIGVAQYTLAWCEE
jgi:hypothetical protein